MPEVELPERPRRRVRRNRRVIAIGAAAIGIVALGGGALAMGLGDPVPAEPTAASVTQDAKTPAAKTPAATTPEPVMTTPEATPTVPPVAVSPGVQAQLDYVHAHWSSYNAAPWGVLAGNDCVNFTSQSLVARGWAQSGQWYNHGDVYSSSSTWRSSTAMRDWLASMPDAATALDDSRRSEVRLGDIVQFDWDNSGDRDHTGVVTRIDQATAGTKIYFAGHTLDSDYRDVDEAITVDHPGGAVFYWRLNG